MGTTRITTVTSHRMVALAGVALGVVALAGCSNSSVGPTAAGGTVTVTSTTTPPPSSTSVPPTTTSSPPTTTVGTPGTPASGPAPSAASGAVCSAGNVTARVEPAAGGGSAGHILYTLIVTNSGKAPCTIQGYPGVSLVAPGTGKQLGAAADRVPGETPLMRLEPGKTAVSPVNVAQAANFGGTCGMTDAAGFRVYLPGETRALFTPVVLKACTPATVKQLTVKAFSN